MKVKHSVSLAKMMRCQKQKSTLSYKNIGNILMIKRNVVFLFIDMAKIAYPKQMKII